ncbi:50S ribosomal protein L27 [bacterium]|nr:MAG: 50S ribosomal protein L27 [bacterium]
MAHKKAAGGGIRQHKNPAGKRLGVKKTHGEMAQPGNIIVRQKGTRFHPGIDILLAKDFTLVAKKEGKISFRRMPKNPKRIIVDIVS